VGSIDLVVGTTSRRNVTDMLRSWGLESVDSGTGGQPYGFTLFEGLVCRVHCQRPEEFGPALALLTASPAHHAALTGFARANNRPPPPLTLDDVGPADSFPREEDFYAHLGLPRIPPELREGLGEVESAAEGRLPALVENSHIRGDLHMHTTSTDGIGTIREMAVAARQRGYQYIAVTDHTRNVKIANGLEVEQVPAYLEEIERVDRTVEGVRVLKGLEVDILKDGSLDMPDEILARLDVVVAAVHSHFDQAAREVTSRVTRAMRNPFVHILAHPTGRLIGQRSALLVDVEELMKTAVQTGTALELNANPERLDVHDGNCRRALELGIPVVISTDAHAVEQMGNMSRGVTQARRGWVTPDDVLNTLPCAEMLSRLRRRNPR